MFHVRWCVKFRIGYFSGTLHFLSFQLQQQSVEGHFMSLKLTDGSTDCQSVGLTLTCSVPFGSNTALYCIYVHMLALFHCYIYIYIYIKPKNTWWWSVFHDYVQYKLRNMGIIKPLLTGSTVANFCLTNVTDYNNRVKPKESWEKNAVCLYNISNIYCFPPICIISCIINAYFL